MHGPNEVALLLPKPGAVLVGGVVFFSCLCGMIVAHLRTRGEQALADGPGFDADGEDLERLIADRTRKLREKVVELEKARAAAIEASTAKSRFLATMSHELRTPLNAILGFSEVIEREMYGAAGDKRYPEYAHHIHESGSHLLAHSRHSRSVEDRGRQDKPKCEVVDVAELAAEACRLTNAERNHAFCCMSRTICRRSARTSGGEANAAEPAERDGSRRQAVITVIAMSAPTAA
jgi:signal transduction histidine kinase